MAFPFELMPSGLLGLLREVLIEQAILGILRIRLVCPERTAALILELAVWMFVRSNPAISEAVIECTHAWAFKDSLYLGQSFRPDVSTFVTSKTSL